MSICLNYVLFFSNLCTLKVKKKYFNKTQEKHKYIYFFFKACLKLQYSQQKELSFTQWQGKISYSLCQFAGHKNWSLVNTQRKKKIKVTSNQLKLFLTLLAYLVHFNISAVSYKNKTHEAGEKCNSSPSYILLIPNFSQCTSKLGFL